MRGGGCLIDPPRSGNGTRVPKVTSKLLIAVSPYLYNTHIHHVVLWQVLTSPLLIKLITDPQERSYYDKLFAVVDKEDVRRIRAPTNIHSTLTYSPVCFPVKTLYPFSYRLDYLNNYSEKSGPSRTQITMGF